MQSTTNRRFKGIDMATLKVIKSDLEHESAIARLMALMDLEPAHGTDDENELEVLSVLIEQYEHENFPIDKPEPIEAIRFRMDQQGLAKKDMVEYFGSASKVSEVLNGKRPLSINMIRKLNKGLGIPADILIQDAQVVPVGKDQKQHVEYARDIAEKFNRIFGETFVLPEALILDDVETIMGTDGRKMSKSYGNVIPLFATDEEIKKAVMAIPTDSKSVEEPKNPEECKVYYYHKL